VDRFTAKRKDDSEPQIYRIALMAKAERHQDRDGRSRDQMVSRQPPHRVRVVDLA
jgi:hypothetical protein